VQDISWYF